jgi:hypothetical protein
MSLAGTHRARAKEWALGKSSAGNEQIAVMFEITQGENIGKSITWFGSFSDKAVDRTLDSLRHCGWSGDNFVELLGLDTNEVELVVEAEEYEGKIRDKVRWVNRPARLALREQLDTSALSVFAARMRTKALAHKQSYVASNGSPAPASKASSKASTWAASKASDTTQYEPSPFPSDDDIPF